MTHLEEADTARDRLGELALPELLANQELARLGLDRQTRRWPDPGDALLDQGGVSHEVVPDILYAHAMALAAKGGRGKLSATSSKPTACWWVARRPSWTMRRAKPTSTVIPQRDD